LLSHYVSKIDGYDGSKKSIEVIKLLHERNPNINGKLVNLAEKFEPLRRYDLIIYGFFLYMITDDEVDVVIENTKNSLKRYGYIFIYDFLSRGNRVFKDKYNKKLNVYKRNIQFYIDKFRGFDLIDFRLFDNRRLKDYLNNDNPCIIDTEVDVNDYNWAFSALFRYTGE
jgi:hypothetical protein